MGVGSLSTAIEGTALVQFREAFDRLLKSHRRVHKLRPTSERGTHEKLNDRDNCAPLRLCYGIIVVELGLSNSSSPRGANVFAPDMLGYGHSPAPTNSYDIAEEVDHLARLLDRNSINALHLVSHSLGSLFGLHLRRVLGARVRMMTVIDPILLSVLREGCEDAACEEMEGQYQRFMDLYQRDHEAGDAFVEHWSGLGAWELMEKRARAMVTALAPKLRLEMIATNSDTAKLAWLAELPPPTTILLGGKIHSSRPAP